MDKFLLQSTEIYIQYPNINHNGENIHRLLWQTIGQDSTLSLQGMQVQSLVRRQIPHAGQCSQKQNKTKKRLNKIMCKYIHTHTMYMYTYMCIIETLCCKAEINRTLESSCASLKKYHHWEKKKDWYVSLYVKFISKENCYKKNMAHYLMAGLQKYLRRCILMSAIYHKMHQGKRLMIGQRDGKMDRQMTKEVL